MIKKMLPLPSNASILLYKKMLSHSLQSHSTWLKYMKDGLSYDTTESDHKLLPGSSKAATEKKAINSSSVGTGTLSAHLTHGWGLSIYL